MDLSRRSLSEQDAISLFETIMRLEELNDINELTKYFSFRLTEGE